MILNPAQAEKLLEEMNRGIVSVQNKAYLPIDTLVQDANIGRELVQENCILKGQVLKMQEEQMKWENGCDIAKSEWEKERVQLYSEINASAKRELALKSLADGLQKEKKQHQKSFRELEEKAEKNRKLSLGELVFIFYLVVGSYTVALSCGEYNFAVNAMVNLESFTLMIGRWVCILFPGIMAYLFVLLLRKLFIHDGEIDRIFRTVGIAFFIIVTLLSLQYFSGSYAGDWKVMYDAIFGLPQDVPLEEIIDNSIAHLLEKGWDI